MDPPGPGIVLEFLQHGFDQGLASTALKVQTVALSVFLDKPLAQDPLVARFFRALTRRRLGRSLFILPWHLQMVLDGLTRAPFQPVRDAPIRLLTF